MKRIMIVEDDFYLRRNLKEILLEQQYEVIDVSTVAEARGYLVRENAIDLFLLDIWLPDGNGFVICKEIRKKTNAPIIFLTVCDDEESVVQGLNLGGDDFVTKPYRIRELLSRIQANLRKKEKLQMETIFRSGELVLDKTQGAVTKAGKLLSLSAVEFALLEVLMENAERIIKREILLNHLWNGVDAAVEDNTLSVTLSRLRSKIGSGYIETVRGFGYRFTQKVYKGICE